MTTARLLLAAAALAFAGGSPSPAKEDPRALKASKKVAVTLPDGFRVKADLVDTPADRERGLMFRRRLAKDYGMLFAFPRELPMSFWMKNTLVSLDIIFIGADKRITRVHERVKPSEETTPDEEVARVGGPAQFVLELPAGAAKAHRLAPGQRLKFDAAIPPR